MTAEFRGFRWVPLLLSCLPLVIMACSAVQDAPAQSSAVPTATSPATRVAPTVEELSIADFRQYYGRSWAIVVAVNTYQRRTIPRLNYAVADARAVLEALPRLGFLKEHIRVLEGEHATKAEFERALYGRMAEMGKNDRLFVFFAGHGELQAIRGGSEGYLLLYDADPDNLPLTAIPMTDMAQIGRRLPVKHVLFALDTCFSGYATRRSVNISGPRPDLTALTSEPVVQVLTAGTQGQLALEQGGHGVFTRYLLRGLEGWADPEGTGLTALKLATYVQDRVIQDSVGKQTPQYSKLDGEGEFLFRPPRTTANQSPPVIEATLPKVIVWKWDDPKIPGPAKELDLIMPSNTVPAQHAAFSGAWAGVWDGFLPSRLIVESVDLESARVVYAWGDDKFNRFKGGWVRLKVRISADNVLTWGTAPVFRFRLGKDGKTVAGEREERGEISTVQMRRVAP